MALTNNIKALITLITTINPIWVPPHESYKDMYYEQKIVTPEKTIATKNSYMKNGTKLTVGATAYYGDPITATGTKPEMGRTIAVDPKVIPYGTKVYIPQFNKVFIAEDCGSAIKGNRIDIYMNTYDECMTWGLRHIDIYILK